jgi:hypothetical protein
VHKIIENGTTKAFPRRERGELDVRIVVLSRDRSKMQVHNVGKGG